MIEANFNFLLTHCCLQNQSSSFCESCLAWWNLLIDGFGCPKHSLISYLRDQSMQSSWCNRSWALVLFAYALLAPSIYLWSFLWKFQNRAHILLGNEWQRKYILLNNPDKTIFIDELVGLLSSRCYGNGRIGGNFSTLTSKAAAEPPAGKILLMPKFWFWQNSPDGKISGDNFSDRDNVLSHTAFACIKIERWEYVHKTQQHVAFISHLSLVFNIHLDPRVFLVSCLW